MTDPYWDVPLCACGRNSPDMGHTLDCHDVKTGECLVKNCACTQFADSGLRVKVPKV